MNLISVRRHAIQAILVGAFFIAGCSSQRPGAINAGGAQGLLKAASTLKSAALISLGGRDTIRILSFSEIDSLRNALQSSRISESLLLTPPPWDVAFLLQMGDGRIFVGLYCGDVIRINRDKPFSTSIIDGKEEFPAAGIADLFLEWEYAAWLFELVGHSVGKPASKHQTLPNRRGIMAPE